MHLTSGKSKKVISETISKEVQPVEHKRKAVSLSRVRKPTAKIKNKK